MFLCSQNVQPTHEFIEFRMVSVGAHIPLFQPFHKPWFQGLELC
jgi:hypothetical protein